MRLCTASGACAAHSAGAEGQEDTLTLVAGFDPTPAPLKTALDKYQEKYDLAVDAAEERAMERALADAMERALAERDAGGAAAGAAAAATGAAAAAPATGAAAAPAGAAAEVWRQCTATDVEKLKQKHAAGTRDSAQATREAQRVWKVEKFLTCVCAGAGRGGRGFVKHAATCTYKQFRDHILIKK